MMLNDLKFVILSPNTIHNFSLTDFQRHQVTTHVLFEHDGELLSKSDYFVDDWSLDRKADIKQHLLAVVASDGCVVIVTYKDELIGFACLEPILFDGYIELSYIHVSKPYRHLGIGKQLFNYIKDQARLRGATKIYIGAHPSVASQAFYHALGCTLATQINQIIYNREPLDLQLEYVLT